MRATAVSIIATVLIGGAFLLAQGGSQADSAVSADNVSVVDGKQIISIRAKGGFYPRTSVAKSGLPTVLRFDTDGTFDCSSIVRIPSMNVSKNLPPSGATDIDVGSVADSTLRGTCGMGMYPFEIVFQG